MPLSEIYAHGAQLLHRPSTSEEGGAVPRSERPVEGWNRSGHGKVHFRALRPVPCQPVVGTWFFTSAPTLPPISASMYFRTYREVESVRKKWVSISVYPADRGRRRSQPESERGCRVNRVSTTVSETRDRETTTVCTIPAETDHTTRAGQRQKAETENVNESAGDDDLRRREESECVRARERERGEVT